jgi:hypothetical protein
MADTVYTETAGMHAGVRNQGGLSGEDFTSICPENTLYVQTRYYLSNDVGNRCEGEMG